MRKVLLAVFLALLWLAVAQQQPAAFPDEAFEAPRGGVVAVNSPGPFNLPDFVRLLVRRSGPFRLEVTRDLRERPVSQPLDLWTVALPEVLKIRVAQGRLEVAAQPARLRLGVDALYNLPVIIRNEANDTIDVKAIGRIGEDGPTDRFPARPGLNYFSLNFRPRAKGSATVSIKLYAGTLLPPSGSPPESTLAREISFPAEIAGWGLLRVRTGVPARVYVTGSDGLSYTPRTLARITWSAGDYYYYSRGGPDEIRIPEGAASVEAMRGFESTPPTATAQVAEGREAPVTLTFDHRENLARDGWYSGDVHIHANYNNHEFITPEDVRDQVEGEDLNVANMMVANSTGPHIHDEQYFEGRPHRLSSPLHIIYWVEEMRNFFVYGHLCLTGLKSIVKPQYTGFANSPWPYDYPANYTQGLEANRQGGAASYAHPGNELTADPMTMNARELPVDLALGAVNALDVLSNSNEDSSAAMWYRLLNTGLRCAISAGSDSFTNRRHMWLPGGQRVYVAVPGPFTYDGWVQNYKAGRSFATNGPILRFTVDGKGPGEEVRLSGPATIALEATATSFVPFDTLEVVANGKVIATARAEAGGRSARLKTTHKLAHSAWIAARARGPYHRLLANDRFAYAHTGPAYALVGNQKIGFQQDAQFFIEWIDKLMALADRHGRYANETQKREVMDLFRKGRAYYEEVARNGRKDTD